MNKDADWQPNCGNNPAKHYPLDGDIYGWDFEGVMGWITPVSLSTEVLEVSLKGGKNAVRTTNG